MKKIKIIATIGPSSIKKQIMSEMVKGGMDCVRINTSHGDFKQYDETIKNIREISNDIPILLDTKGPEIRLKIENEEKSLEVNKGDSLWISFNKDDKIHFDHNFYNKIKLRTRILLKDGLLQTIVIKKTKNKLLLKAINSYKITDGCSVNIPTIDYGLPFLAEKDLKTIKYAVKNKVDFLALSFTQKAENIKKVRKMVKKDITLIAKIEDKQGVKNIDSILEVADGIMIARGDLGVEIKDETIPLIQKSIIHKCNKLGKVVIVATQMLESMIENPRPTRAETSDVANAILDGADAIMLSGETAVGKYPIKAVREMSKISEDVEKAIENNVNPEGSLNLSDAITKSVFQLTRILDIDKIICVTKSGYTAQMMSRFRTNKTIIAITKSEKVKRKLRLVFGVIPIVYNNRPESDKILAYTLFCLKHKLISKKDNVIFTGGVSTVRSHISNSIQVNRIEDILKYYERRKQRKANKNKKKASKQK